MSGGIELPTRSMSVPIVILINLSLPVHRLGQFFMVKLSMSLQSAIESHLSSLWSGTWVGTDSERLEDEDKMSGWKSEWKRKSLRIRLPRGLT